MTERTARIFENILTVICAIAAAYFLLVIVVNVSV